MLFYAVIGGIGLIFVLVMLLGGDVIGGDQEVATLADLSRGDPDAAPSFFTTRVIGAFMMAFGVIGLILRSSGLSHWFAIFIGLGDGLVFGGAVHQIARARRTQRAAETLHLPRFVGQSTQVTGAIPVNGVGQITVTFKGAPTPLNARAADNTAIPQGAAVVITGVRGEMLLVM